MTSDSAVDIMVVAANTPKKVNAFSSSGSSNKYSPA
eukprot:CAMPEP_0176183400 /NCGR_PEP_ID=MMETSP0121_2-20121125/270_1 /TAXON_ID=160619 /ORGANISM="Kryptoperidinium foliaceum, Strain CCMP 1326" /LENGTH=35 /DNA_ID= /DNA_START= /DNA_END= /DNA_ORIENTATION=